MIKVKENLITIVLSSMLSFLACSAPSQKSYDYKFLERNKYHIQRVDFENFRKSIDSGKFQIRIEDQDKFLREFLKALNDRESFCPERGYNFNSEINKKKFAEFIFDDVLKKKLNFDVKNPSDVVVGLNMALEFLVKYNYSMLMPHSGLGSDVDHDGRFDGIDWYWRDYLSNSLFKKIKENPIEGRKILLKEEERVDKSAPDKLLMLGKGEPNKVKLICRNYMSSLKVMFEAAKVRYPKLTKNIELFLVTMPGHVFGGFINKKTLEYIPVDPTWNDSAMIDPKNYNFVDPNFEKSHDNSFMRKGYFEIIGLENRLYQCSDIYESEIFFHYASEKMVMELLPSVEELSKRYPESPHVTILRILTYAQLSEQGFYSKAYQLLKKIYDNKKNFNKLNSHYIGLTLYLLGESSFRRGNYKDALSYFKKCKQYNVIKNSFVDDAMVGIAKAYLEGGDNFEALFRARDVIDISSFGHEEAKDIALSAAFRLNILKNPIDQNLEKAFFWYVNGKYDKIIKKVKGKDSLSKLFIAKSYAGLNNYKKAKSLFDILKDSEDSNVSRLASLEMQNLNEKFFIYGYRYAADKEYGLAIDKLKLLKDNIKTQNSLSEKVSYLLFRCYDSNWECDKAVEEARYFMKTFPNSRFRSDVENYLKDWDDEYSYL